MNNTGKNTIKLVSTAMMSVVIAICAWITVPFTVPFTMQIFGVFLALMLLGGKYGTMSILIYILLGLFGIPVFSGFSAGPGALLGPTGGYIAGFLAMGFIIWIINAVKKGDAPIWAYLLALSACYILGTLWFCYVMGTKGSDYSFTQALMLCVVPYIIPDLLKLSLAKIVALKLRKIMP